MTDGADELEQLRAEVAQARDQLAQARAQTRAAYRDSARLVRLLSEIARPARDRAEQLQAALEALSEAFDADVVCLTHHRAGGVAAPDVVTASCGFALGAAASLPPLPTPLRGRAPDAGAQPCAAWAATGGPPLVVAGVEVRSGARLVLDPRDAAAGALLVLRGDATAFTTTELQLLQSVALRLHAALEATERRSAAELLSTTGDRFTRHLTVEGLLGEVIALLAGLTGAQWVGVLEVVDEHALLRAQGGSLGADLSASWPRPCEELLAWPEAVRGRAFLCHDLSAVREHPDAPPRTELHSVLATPVVVDGRTRFLLYALHRDPHAFSPVVVQVLAQLAGHLASAVLSAGLHSALAHSEQQLRHRATHDALTGLANRSLMREELERRLAPDGGHEHVGVLFCDLDGFKAVNDRLGHDAGDQLLRTAGDRMRASVRPGDLLSRLGGDEFVVLVAGLEEPGALEGVGERLLDVLSAPYDLVDAQGLAHRVSVGASVGATLAASGPDPARAASGALRDADAAMYAAKRAGGSRTCSSDGGATALAAPDASGAERLGPLVDVAATTP